MSWFTPKASQEDFEYLVKKVQRQNTEIIRLEGKVQALDTALSLLRIRVTELENLDKAFIDSNVKRQAEGFNRPGEVPQGHSNVTHHYTNSSPDLSTVMLISALASDSSPSSSCDSSSCDSSSSCGGE